MLLGNFNILFVMVWKVECKLWMIVSGGISEEGGIYKFVDGGESWEKVIKGLFIGFIGKIDVVVCFFDLWIVYVLVEVLDDEGGFYWLVDQGSSFQQVFSFGGIWICFFYYINICIDFQDVNIVYVLVMGYYKFVDGGKYWQWMCLLYGDNYDMWINLDNFQLFIQVNDGGVNVIYNGGEIWFMQFNQFIVEIYQVEVDYQFFYWFYGGQQDNYIIIVVLSLLLDVCQVDGIGWIINMGGCEMGFVVFKFNNLDIVYFNCKGCFGVFDKCIGVECFYYVGVFNMYGYNFKDLCYCFQWVLLIYVLLYNLDVVYYVLQFVYWMSNDGVSWEIILLDFIVFEVDKQVIFGSFIIWDIIGEEFYSIIYVLCELLIMQGLIWVGVNDGFVYVI